MVGSSHGELEGRTKIVEEKLASKLVFSQTPMRNFIRRLEYEALSIHTVVFYNRPFLIDEHEDIYKAIKERNAEKAEALMQEHLQKDLEFCLHLLQRRQ